MMGESRVGSPVSLLHLALLTLLVAMLILLGIASLWWPFSWDHGIFAWIGDAIVHGGMPYRDAWDIKGPLTYYIFASTEWLFGKGMWGIRVFDLLMLCAGTLAAGRIVQLLSGPGAGAYTALVIALQYLGTGNSETAQPDGWAAFLLLLGLVPLVEDEAHTSLRRATLSALLLGTCVLLKPPYAVFLVAPVVYVLLARDLGVSAKIRGVVLAGAAFIFPSLLCAAWFAWRGALDSLFDTYILFNAGQASSPLPGLDTSLRGAFHRFARRILFNPAVMVAGLAALIALVALRRDRRRAAAVLAITTLTAFFTVYVQQRYWNRYHWHVAYMPLSVLAGIGIGHLWHRAPIGRWTVPLRALATGVGTALLIFVLPEPLHEVRRWLDLMRGRLTPAEYDTEFRDPALSWTITDSRALAQYLRVHTTADERVLIWSDPLVNYLSDRASTGRLIFFGPLNVAAATSQHQRYRDEFLRDLARHPPRYFAVGRRNLVDADSLNPANIAHQFPALYAKLMAEYVPVTRFGEMKLFERRAEQPPVQR
jgi:4-amino-4-deoxy-L-arabinose transferase-like glycosyltransferase